MTPDDSDIRLCKWCKRVTYAYAANWFLLFAVSGRLGGNTQNGRITADHYFLENHGKFTEVSVRIYETMRIWEFLTFGTFFFVFLLMLGANAIPGCSGYRRGWFNR